MLQAVNAAVSRSVSDAYLDRLFVWNRISLTEPLPLAYERQIAKIDGVAAVAHATWTGTWFQDPRQVVYSTPVDAQQWFAYFRELVIPTTQLEAFITTRTGAVISTALAKKFGWKIGDRVTLNSVFWTRLDGTSAWTFDIVGIFSNPRDEGRGEFLFNYGYFDEARSFGKGTVGWYFVRVANPGVAARVSADIDKRFANSSDETNTQTESASAQSLLMQFADVDYIVTGVVAAVFFTLLLLAGNNMAQSVRVRTPELAVLKAFGYSDALILTLVFGESLVLCESGAAVGLGAASALFPALQNVIGLHTQPLQVILSGLAAASLLALIAGVGPALRANRLQIVDALAGR